MSKYRRWVKAIKLDRFLHIDSLRHGVGGHDVTEFLLIQCVKCITQFD
jgi:hypothetical protein